MRIEKAVCLDNHNIVARKAKRELPLRSSEPSSFPQPEIVLELLEEILRRADAGEALAVCTVVRTRGSTPQKTGAVMLVTRDGQTLGTIGGGCVEAEVRTRALQQLD